MTAAAIKTDAEAQTPVVILANDLERFNLFGAFLTKNGFPCQVFNELQYSQFDSTPTNTVFYISFNFNGAHVIQVTQDLEHRLGMTCIVFAESDDFQTAAKLSSAKMTQTLQHPYTQKNFLMGLQTIVKKRKTELAKEQRRQNHRRADQPLEETAAELVTKFSREKNPIKDNSVIIQEGINLGPTRTTVIPGEEYKSQTVVQEGQQSDSLFAHVKGDKVDAFFTIQHQQELTRNNRQFEPLAKQSQTNGHIQEIQPADISTTHAPNQSTVAPKEHEAASPTPVQSFDWDRLQQTIDAQFMDNRWAILSVSCFGIVICLYCLYQMLTMGR